jgi:hypothetical protein
VATDTFYDHIYFAGSISVLAYREGMAKGLRGPALAQFVKATRANPPDSYKPQAIADVKKRTAQRKLRGRCVVWLALIIWVSSVWTVTNALSASATVTYFLAGIVAVFFIGGLFQILFGLSNLLRDFIIGAYEWIVGRLTGREVLGPIDEIIEFALKLIFGLGIFVSEALVTFLVAHWAFESLVI